MFRVLCPLLGDSNYSSNNWNQVILKVKAFATRHNPSMLTVTGRIVIANACIVGCAIFCMQHGYVPPDAINQLTSVVNQYTNGNSKVGQLSYKEKIKPRSHGGPMITLLDPTQIVISMTAKPIFRLTDNLIVMHHDRYIGYMIDHIMHRARECGIHILDHALLCTIPI